MRDSGLPAPQPVRLTSSAMEMVGRRHAGARQHGGRERVSQPVLGATHPVSQRAWSGEREENGARVAQLEFSGLSDAVVEQLDKLIFRHHRRLVAGTKTAVS